MSGAVHTATRGPWTTERRNLGSSVFVVYGADGLAIVKTVDARDAKAGEPEANARRIVQCVNAHDELMETLRMAYGLVVNGGATVEELDRINAAIRLGSIAKAGGAS